jgi:hypothetical protein
MSERSVDKGASGLVADALAHVSNLVRDEVNLARTEVTENIKSAGIAGWAALIVGVLFAIIAFMLASKGMNDLKIKNIAPTRTAKNVRRDAEAVKEAYNDKR